MPRRFAPRNDEKGRHEEGDLHHLQELQRFLIVHIGRNACKSKFLMCILQNELHCYIIAHMFYIFKRRWVIGGRLLTIARRGNPPWLPTSVEVSRKEKAMLGG